MKSELEVGDDPIDDIDRLQNAPTSEMPKIDMDKLRRLLGLPAKAN